MTMTTTTDPTPADEARRRLGRIAYVLPVPSFHDDLAAIGAPSFAEMADDDALALVAKYDRPGHWIARREPATTYRPEQATVGCLLPNGDQVTFDCVGETQTPWHRPCAVNWPSIGSSSPEVASSFAAALLFASGVASTLEPQIVETDEQKQAALDAAAAERDVVARAVALAQASCSEQDTIETIVTNTLAEMAREGIR